MKVYRQVLYSTLILMLATVTSLAQRNNSTSITPEMAALPKKIARFAPTEMTANISQLSASDQKALQKIIAAAKLFDALYRRQTSGGNESLLNKLAADTS